MKVKMIIERIIKALLKIKIIHSLKLLDSHDLVSRIISLSIFLLMRPESFPLVRLAKSLVKCFCFYQEICFSFFTNGACKF